MGKVIAREHLAQTDEDIGIAEKIRKRHQAI
jgi:hypothetical protein